MKLIRYTLRIGWGEPHLSSQISEILNTQPYQYPDEKPEEAVNDPWEYTIIEEPNGPYFDFVDHFLGLLENNYEKLEKIGIERDRITVFITYEYVGQCNTCFSASNLKRLGEQGIKLCITCWENFALENQYGEDWLIRHD